MAGRGCTIHIQLLSNRSAEDADAIDDVTELSLPVALHSPLEVLHQQLETLTGIPANKQVL